MSQRRISENTQRTYQGEHAATSLVSYLNSKGEEGKAGRGRIAKVIEAFHHVLKLIDKYPSSEWTTYGSFKPKELGLLKIPRGMSDVRRKPDELAAAENSLLEHVGRYERILLFGIGNEGDCAFSWGLATASKDVDWEKEEWGAGSESGAVDAIVELSREKLLVRVQKCECGKWFFARFSHQHFCSPRCRSRHQRLSPEFKAVRREYMRKYYRVQKQNVK